MMQRTEEITQIKETLRTKDKAQTQRNVSTEGTGTSFKDVRCEEVNLQRDKRRCNDDAGCKDAGEIVSQEILDILESRADFYLTLAGFYYKPLTQEQIDYFAEQDFCQFITGESILDDGFNDIGRALRKRHTGTRSILATEWTSIFGGAEAYKGLYCVPDASVFLDKSGLTYGKPRNIAYEIYRKQCLRLCDDSGMPESHLSVELEFLSIMSREASNLLRAGEFYGAIEKLDISRDFIEEHILSWLPRLIDRATPMFKTRFYRGVLRLTIGYLNLDLQTLDDIKLEVSEK